MGGAGDNTTATGASTTGGRRFFTRLSASGTQSTTSLK